MKSYGHLQYFIMGNRYKVRYYIIGILYDLILDKRVYQYRNVSPRWTTRVLPRNARKSYPLISKPADNDVRKSVQITTRSGIRWDTVLRNFLYSVGTLYLYNIMHYIASRRTPLSPAIVTHAIYYYNSVFGVCVLFTLVGACIISIDIYIYILYRCVIYSMVIYSIWYIRIYIYIYVRKMIIFYVLLSSA